MRRYPPPQVRLLLASAAILFSTPIMASAQDAGQPSKTAPTLATSYRGVFVCEQAPGAPNILRCSRGLGRARGPSAVRQTSVQSEWHACFRQ